MTLKTWGLIALYLGAIVAGNLRRSVSGCDFGASRY